MHTLPLSFSITKKDLDLQRLKKNLNATFKKGDHVRVAYWPPIPMLHYGVVTGRVGDMLEVRIVKSRLDIRGEKFLFDTRKHFVEHYDWRKEDEGVDE